MSDWEFREKLKSYLKIIFLWFFVNALPYFISDFRIKIFAIKLWFWKVFLVLLAWILLASIVFMFSNDIKQAIEDSDLSTWEYIVLCIIFSIFFLLLLTHNIIF